MKMVKVSPIRDDMRNAVEPAPNCVYYPRVYLSDAPVLPDSKVGDIVTMQVRGKLCEVSTSEHGNSLAVEIHAVGFKGKMTEYEKMAEEDMES